MKIEAAKRFLTAVESGEIFTGEDMQAALGVKQTTVWNHLRALRDMGVVIDVPYRTRAARPWRITNYGLLRSLLARAARKSTRRQKRA